METDNKKYVLSVVIPVCNNPDYFQLVVSEVLNQTKSEVEIVVVDESNKENLDLDKSHILLFNDERIKHIVKRTSGNPIKAGVKNATGNIIAIVPEEQTVLHEQKNGFIDKVVTKIKGD